MTETVAMCVCTAKRPKMLAACLQSLTRQTCPPDFKPIIVVVDNEAEPNNRHAVQGAADASPIPVYYVHEPMRGISQARNAALTAALKLDAEWVAFIDDDETAGDEWLMNLMSPEYLYVPILTGRRYFLPPTPRPFWYVDKKEREMVEGASVRLAFTHNVRMSREVFQDRRFDPAMALTGGEDTAFFTDALKDGFIIRQTSLAITYETVVRERLTFRAHMYRAGRVADAAYRRCIEEKGKAISFLQRAHSVPLGVVFGLAELAISPLFVVGGLSAFKRRAINGGKKIGTAWGRSLAMVGYTLKPYARIVGY